MTLPQLDVLQLSEQAVPVAGSYTNSDSPGLPPRLHVEYDALERYVIWMHLDVCSRQVAVQLKYCIVQENGADLNSSVIHLMFHLLFVYLKHRKDSPL